MACVKQTTFHISSRQNQILGTLKTGQQQNVSTTRGRQQETKLQRELQVPQDQQTTQLIHKWNVE